MTNWVDNLLLYCDTKKSVYVRIAAAQALKSKSFISADGL